MKLKRTKQRGTFASLGMRIKEVRSKHGISQLTLADKTGTSQGTISKIEKGKMVGPNVAVVLAVTLALPEKLDLTDWYNGKWETKTRGRKNGSTNRSSKR